MFLFLMITGYVWVYINYNNHAPSFGCFFKYATNIPCPSCGTTRAIMSIFAGDIGGGFKFNPLGYVYIVAMIVIPICLIIDLVFQKNHLINAYDAIIFNLSKKNIAFPFFSILIINWIWNIFKML